MICERAARRIEHLKQEIPYEAVGFFDFVKEKNALLVPREYIPKPSEAAAFVSHEQFYAVQVEELGHVKAVNVLGSEQLASEFQRQLRFSHTGRSEKQERP